MARVVRRSSGERAANRINNSRVNNSALENDKASLTATKKKSRRLDVTFLIIVLVLLSFGIVMVFSASYPAALQKYDDSLYLIKKHALFVVVGLVVMFLASYFDYHKYRRFIIPIVIVSLALLALVLVPGIGTTHGTFARRWIDLGPLSFQPSEIMKFTVILLFAHWVSVNHKRMKEFYRGFIKFGFFLGIVGILMLLEPHMSGTILILGIGLVMMFVGGTRILYLVSVFALGASFAVGLFLVKGATYITERLQVWLDPFNADSIKDGSFQTVQSLIAIGSGGVLGRGIGNSRQKYLYLPESYNDYIFAIICEELGLVGALAVIVLFVVFALRGLQIAAKAPDKFGFMICVGITVQVCLQAVLNIAVVTNTVPPTGISLPFFSYGGTALVMLMGEIGIMLNISRHATSENSSTDTD